MGFDARPDLGYDSGSKMSVRTSHFKADRAAFFAACALAIMLGSATQARSQGVPIEYYEPQAGMVSTNLNQLGLGETDSKALEDEFSKPKSAFVSGQNSMEAIRPLPFPTPAAPTAVPDRRAKERSKHDWAFTTPEDLLSTLTPEAMLGVPEYGPDGMPKNSLSSMERYYDRLMSERKPGTTGRSDLRAFSEDQSDSAMNGLPGELGRAEKNLKSFVKPQSGYGIFSDSPASSGNASGLWDSFGFNSDNSLGPEELRTQQQAIQSRNKELEKIWNYNQPVVASAPAPIKRPVFAEVSKAPVVSNPYKDRNSTYSPYGNARASLPTAYPGQSSFAPVLSADQQQPQPGKLRPLMFDFPRRNFD